MSPTNREPSSPGRRAIVRVGQVLLTGVITWFIARQLGVSLEGLTRLDLDDLSPDWPWLTGSVVLLTLGYFTSATIWGVMVADLGGPRLGPYASSRIFFTANLGRYIPGKLWQIAGLAYLGRSEGVAPGVSTLSAVVGQGLALCGATLIGSSALLAMAKDGPEWGFVAAGVILLVLLTVGIPPVFRRLLQVGLRLSRQTLPPGQTLRPSLGFRWLTLYTGNWIIYAASFWALARGLGAPLGPVESGGAFAASYVLGYVALFAPAGVGIREASLLGLLQPIVGPGAAWSIAVIGRAWTTVVELLLALPFALWQVRSGARTTARDGRDE